MTKIEVKLGTRSYPVLIGSDMNRHLDGLIREHAAGGRVFAVYDARFYTLHGVRLQKEVRALGNKAIDFVLPSGERTKSARTVQRLQDFFISNNISRSDLVVAVGGGVTTDVTGYAAATTLRGVKWAAVPTTLLGMVDAAIGGKTAINHKAGKNLIGAFWQPSFVCCDLRYLHTLPVREMMCGLGEVVKYCGLIGDKMIKLTEAYLDADNLYDEAKLKELVTLSAACKAAVVMRDECEAGERMILNLGHTFGHGVEKALQYKRLLHGEAVLVGLLGALELSVLDSAGSGSGLERYRQLVEKCAGLLPQCKVDAARILQAMGLDKKRAGSALRFVLLERPGKPIITERPGRARVKKAIDRMLTAYKGGKG